jgi:exonuclease SbcC
MQTPADRKKVLGVILGLDRWTEYGERARKRLSESQGELRELERRIQDTEAELARRPEHEIALQQAEQEAQQAAARLQEAQQRVDTLHRIEEQAAALNRQIADQTRRLDQERQRAHALQQNETAQHLRLAGYKDRLQHAAQIEADYQIYLDTGKEERAWGEKLSQAALLQEEKSGCERQIEQARQELAGEAYACEREALQLEQQIARLGAELESALSALHGQIQSLKDRVTDPQLAAELQTAREALQELETLAADLERSRRQLQENQVEQSRRQERNRQLKDEMNKTKASLDTLAEAEACCPLCRQPLTPEHHEQMLTEMRAEGQKMGDEYRANTTRLQTLKEEIAHLETVVRDGERRLLERPRREQTVARLLQQIEQSEEARQRIASLSEKAEEISRQLDNRDYGQAEQTALAQARARHQELQSRLERETYAGPVRAALTQVLQQLIVLGYDLTAHNRIKARLIELAPSETAYRELEKARAGIQSEEETLQRLTQELAAQRERISGQELELQALQDELERLRPQIAEAPQAVKVLMETRQSEALARQRVGATRQTLNALQIQETRLQTMRHNREKLGRQIAMLTDLRDAFGINGIPAMLIEHTLPELEAEANRILEQLTNGRMHVRLESQRETKTGTLRETLDIIISDEKGTRPYESFSGGEQFRVNFALRVALSRLLSQRAGVRLRSLFIDEGFGSLDGDGRRRLVEAVKTIQSEFDLILIITHIEELQDTFPVRIQVIKTENGSQVEIN